MATGQRWQEPIELGQCWVRAGQLSKAVEQPQNLSLSFAELHIQRVDLNLFDAQGRLIGRAQRMGSNSNALGSGQRAAGSGQFFCRPTHYSCRSTPNSPWLTVRGHCQA
jgi:hypothetical protein